ncbi:hypothetical protein WR25_13501 [Diploscapter pachys]|uniref:NR LBD domain-containing protein n=1 Tax=Diploscapter pachys TaxID=2018661 RepID=A0A2A2JVX0_9BILA|nr:hypothetical protein WR25_13501 [Diploscapter pachys]
MSEVGSPSCLDDDGMPTLTQLNLGYLHMNEIRNVIHAKDKNKMFGGKSPRAVAYKEANAVHTREVSLVADWVLSSYPHFEKLDSDQKKVLFKNFFLPFVMLETGYYCVLHDRTDIIYLPSGDYIDTAHPESFYHDEEGKQKMSTEDAVKLFAPSFEIYRRNILDPMRRDRVDVYEFYTMCSLVLWDHGLEGQSPESEEVSRSAREVVIKELIFYYKHVKKLNNFAARIASLLILLPSLLRAVRRFQEDVEISHVFSVYSVDDQFYQMVNGKF